MREGCGGGGRRVGERRDFLLRWNTSKNNASFPAVLSSKFGS
jgi:hypothetical protein